LGGEECVKIYLQAPENPAYHLFLEVFGAACQYRRGGDNFGRVHRSASVSPLL
jgi:hypothetical protein